jgi:hypothetical protein
MFAGVFKLAISKRMLPLLPELIWTGISLAYFSGILVEMMSSCLNDYGHSV